LLNNDSGKIKQRGVHAQIKDLVVLTDVTFPTSS